MQELIWYLHANSLFELVSARVWPFIIGFVLLQGDFGFILVRFLLLIAKYGKPAAPIPPGRRPAALLVMPTLIRNAGELEGLEAAISSAANNGYLGALYIVASIDDGMSQPALFADLQAWIARFPAPKGVRIFAIGTPERQGKAVAIDAAVRFVEQAVKTGEVPEFPPLFFNMDGDSQLEPHALVRMADRLLRPSRITGKRPTIVTSNVCIRPDHYWQGWRTYFTVRGQLPLLVALEFLTTITVGKYNLRVLPVVWASGALYCTWSELHILSPRWAAFMQTLRFRDWAAWWIGAAPPCFRTSGVEDLPEAQTGPGDDTWMSWLACCARWEGDDLTVELPRTPAHAAYYAISQYFFRPLAFEPEARIFTKTPTTIRGLFKQRVRWNSSRVQDVGRWRAALAYHWGIGIPVAVLTWQLFAVNAAVIGSLLLWPFVSSRGFFVAASLAFGVNLFVRTLSALFALLIDGGLRRDAAKLLALPLIIPFHFVFNVSTTIVGCVADVLFFGVNTGFSPEQAHIKSRLSRIAIAYRVRRALALAVRAIVHNDVPLGWFWFGWHATPFTPNGFEGWTTGKSRVLRSLRPPTSTAAPEVLPARIAPARVPIFSFEPPATAAAVAQGRVATSRARRSRIDESSRAA